MTLKRARWFHRWSLASSKMTIKTQAPWPLKALVFALVLGGGGALALWTYDLGRNLAGFSPGTLREQVTQLKELKAQLEKLTVERDQLATGANGADSKWNIERSAQQQQAKQVKALEADNIRLKEDLAFFESLLPTDTGPRGIAIRRLKVDMVAPNQLRYRVLVMQGGKGNVDFNGNLQLAVTTTQAGKSVMILFPDVKAGDADKYKISFKHYQRLEGVLTLPEGAAVKVVQARVLEKGQMRTQQSANL
jgi:hypothetical protein